MAQLVGCFQLYRIIILLGTVTSVIGFGNHCKARTQMFHAAENRALKRVAYANRTVRSSSFCGIECNRDRHCKSFNFYERGKVCELNNTTRKDFPKDLIETHGSVYFDADEDTPLFSVAGHYRSCKMLLYAGYRSSGIYTIYPDGISDGGLRVYCDMETDGGGWIVFQRRQDGSVDFYRNWTEYQSGFGDLPGEFWLGNDNLVTLTSDDAQGTWKLRVDLEDWVGITAWATYPDFKISQGEYILNIGQYDASSTAGDSLGYHRGRPFSTKDRDNDISSTNCAQYYKGAWWFGACVHSDLNGIYYPDEHAGSDRGIYWYHWKGSYSMKKCNMKMRETGV